MSLRDWQRHGEFSAGGRETAADREEMRLFDLERKYNELLYAVAQKFPGESRHETALRYIREREAGLHTRTAEDKETTAHRATRGEATTETNLSPSVGASRPAGEK